MDAILMEKMLRRRSVRKYTGEAVSDEALDAVINAGLVAPTGRNKQSVEFIVLRDKDVLNTLSKCRPVGPGMLAGADAAVVVIGNPEESDVWTEDCSIAMAQMHLMADAIGLGSCWVQIRNRMYSEDKTTDSVVKELLAIPEKYAVEAILSLGMPAEHAPARTVEELNRELVHTEKF
ncbi:MAG: nitroreductase family protein [Clostridiales bacterium]|nr:nitroreductase family protein [Candidatus Crickella merdequi]